MSILEVIKALDYAGATPNQILSATCAMRRSEQEKKAAKREKNRQRYLMCREMEREELK